MTIKPIYSSWLLDNPRQLFDILSRFAKSCRASSKREIYGLNLLTQCEITESTAGQCCAPDKSIFLV